MRGRPRLDRLRRQRARHARPSGGGRACPRRGGVLGAFLRPLRRAAGRSAGALGSRPVRAAAGAARRRQQGDRGARRRRRQRAADDLRRGLPRLEGGDRRPAAAGERAARGRGGIGRRQFAGLSRRQPRRAPGGRGADLRHRHVGRRDARHHHEPARALRRGDGDPRRRPRPAFGHVRVGGDEPQPRAGAGARRPARRRRAGGDPRLLRRRARAARGDQGRLGGARLRRAGVPRGGRPRDPRRREGAERAGDDLVASDLRGQRHGRRLPGRRVQDGDPGGGRGQGLVPPGVRPGPRGGARGLPRLRPRADAGRLPGGVPPARRRPGGGLRHLGAGLRADAAGARPPSGAARRPSSAAAARSRWRCCCGRSSGSTR